MSTQSRIDIRKKRVTFDDEVVFGNSDDQETPTDIPSSSSSSSSPFVIRERKEQWDEISHQKNQRDKNDDLISSSLPSKSSLTRLLEHSSTEGDHQNQEHFPLSSAIDQQKNYRAIKQRYFQSLGVRQPSQMKLPPRQPSTSSSSLSQQKYYQTSPSRRRAVSEAVSRDNIMSSRQRRAGGIPIPNSDQPSPLAMALQMETTEQQQQQQQKYHQHQNQHHMFKSSSMDALSGSPSVAIPISGAIRRPQSTIDLEQDQDVASTLGASFSVRKHPRYLDEYGSGGKDEEEFLPPHLMAERDRSEFSVYQHRKNRGAMRNMQIFGAT